MGEAAPQFEAELIDGGTFDLRTHLAEQSPRAVVLNLWASWCLPCREEIPEISAFADQHPDVSVIGVAVQDSESASRAFAAEIRASYPLALSEPGFDEDYPWVGLPATYVIGIQDPNVSALSVAALDAMAEAGRRPQTGALHRFYAGTSESELRGALTRIRDEVGNCLVAARRS